MRIENVIMRVVAVSAPVPTAWLVGQSTFTLMGFPLPVAIAAALTVEGLGFVAVNTVNEMIEFNRHINSVEAGQKMHAPVRQAAAVAALYAATAAIMTVMLHIVPALVPYAPLPFIVMMGSVGWLYALRQDHEARVSKWGAGRSQAKAIRSANKKIRSSGRSVRSAVARVRSSAARALVPCRYAGAGCSQSGSQNAMNAHARACKFKPVESPAAAFEAIINKSKER